MAIKFETNLPLRVRFPYGDHKEVNGQYGLQFMYTVGAPCSAHVVSLS